MKKEDALKIAELFQENFECEELNEDNHVVSRGFQITKGSNTIRLKSLHPTDDLSYISNYYQIGPYSIHTQNLAAILALFLDPKAFDFLRTKQQLSYNVKFSLMKLDKILGFVLSVRSNENVHDFVGVYNVMEEFINVLCRKYVNEMTDDEFQGIKNGRIAVLSEPDLSLSHEFSRNLREIQEEAYSFNRTEEAIEDANSITKEDIQKFFESIFYPQNMRKLIVQVIGKRQSEGTNETSMRQILNEKTEIDENMIADIQEFQESLYLYPVNYN